MVRTDYVAVVCPAGGEKVYPVLNGIAAVKRHVRRVAMTPTANALLVAYIDTDRYVRADSNILPALDPWVPIDRDLAVGETLHVGIRDLAAAGHTLNVIFEWEE